MRSPHRLASTLSVLWAVTSSGATPASAGIHFPPPGETLAQQDPRAPAEVGLDAGVVNALAGSADRWALWRHGYLVHVAGDFNLTSESRSVRKTVYGVMVGAALGQRIPSIDQRVSVWVPELRGNDALATWRQVMTQSASFDYPGCGDARDYLPGEIFTYSDLNAKNLCRALARAYGRDDYDDDFRGVVSETFADAIGLQGWDTVPLGDGVRLLFDLEDMGRIGLLLVAKGSWNGQQIVADSYLHQLETKQTQGMAVDYSGCNDGVYPSQLGLTQAAFPEVPYGFMTWTNSDGDYHPGASPSWAFASGSNGGYLLWNRDNGIVYVGFGVDAGTSSDGIPHVIEDHLLGPNPLVESPAIPALPHGVPALVVSILASAAFALRAAKRRRAAAGLHER